ncbi:HlyD family type I secretion periplasmic adaptor subunit [Paracoccus denitrificans]|jgi:adhesin transport system membrane fusion protein|uniref:Membrane fusion protein (MFP) family protein n=1 Tax=Paracoccus denitrificans (strain Pd 1222) TaxID=318586 RepID=A1B4Q6_PARDP|nr:HlyD family type I secretion periplasmic adaptor subunit [Paracoccus denitrificans]ABL70500.1 type I secretion membrane fusion protein, HlyD family [Paracoccus denitrificans PD1222]MBB4629691.1 adhesin transport system membrane fusion protein [Paracoccus denitrificans]MCU7431107.1 HlyD family type I secretion periplasmic adaptor subunit [Paracoccus denitrificans]QAR25840.1 HlyD family type I secretion periplasmic adaptor subunit [Paracoccus denitrificans]UPV94742.1 HlyD family type I secret
MMGSQAANTEDVGLIFGEEDEVRLTRSKRVVLAFFALLASGLVWAHFAVLDEVSTGTARVVPTMREQVIQSLEGGILTSLEVRPDEVVEPGQILARLDPTRNEAEVEESASKYRAALATATRLQAEITGQPLVFPEELSDFPDLIAVETQLYAERKRSLEAKLEMLDQAIDLTGQELTINERLKATGATSNIDVLRLKKQKIDLEMQKSDTAAQFHVQAREDLTRAEAEIAALRPIVRSRSDVVTRLTLRSPVRGIVKNIEVSTIGGVVSPNGKLMDIIPLDDQLMIEAKITPRDIAFIRPGLSATVKVSAYDYAVYGGLKGEVVTISPDTIQDEINRDQFYYRVLIRAESDALVNDAGQRFPIVPGMMATVDIHTGQKTVLEYLIQPFNRAGEAMRER